MKVRTSNKVNTVDFATLKPGDCFEAWDTLYVKSQSEQQATGLVNGQARVSMCGIQVTPVNAEILIID